MPIAAYSPAELEKAKDILSRTGPREIHDQYLVGNMTSGERRAALTAWAQAKRALYTQGGPTGVGEVDAYIKGVVEQYQKIWGVDARGRTGVDVVQALMLAVQVLGALDIPGDLVERKALQYGASPGLAYLMNWAVWIPVNFIGLGTWLKPVTFALGKGAKSVEATAIGSRKFLTYLTGRATELDTGAAAKAGELGKVSTAAQAGEAAAVKRAITAAEEGAVGEAAGGVVKAGPAITPESRIKELAPSAGLVESASEINAKTWYHGSGTKGLTAETLDPTVTRAEGLFGQGIYLTDNPTVAQGYAKARGKSTESIVYEAQINVQKVLNIETPITPEILAPFVKAAKSMEDVFGAEGLVDAIKLEAGKSDTLIQSVWRKLSQEASDLSHQERIPNYEFSEVFSELGADLKRLGYDAITYTGGKRTKGIPHQALMLLDPNDFISQTGRIGQVSKFVTQTAEEFGVTKELLEQALTSPQKLEALSVDQLLDFYRLRAQEQVRKGVTHLQTEAEQVGAVSFDDLVLRVRGTGATAAEAKEMIFLGDQILKGLDTFLERALPHVDDIANGTRPELIAEWKSHVMALAKANPAILGATGEIGRGLEILKTVQPELGAIRAYDGILQALGGEALAEGTTKATAAAMQRFALLGKEAKAALTTEAARGQASDFLHRMYKSLLLVMPSTQIVNTVGSLQGALGKLVEQTGAAAMPFAKGGPSVHEAIGMCAGMIGNLGKMPTLWRQAVEGSAKRFAKQEIAGVPTDVVTRYGPLRWIGIEDELVGAALENALVTGKLVEQGLNRGLKGSALRQFLDESMGNPQIMAELTERVAPMVDEALFRTPLSQFSEGMIKLKNDTGIDYYLPFVRTLVNLIKQEVDWLPGLQMLRGKFWKELKDPALEGAARTRLVLGWMTAQNIYAAAKAGIITGGGPTDPELNRQWRQNNIPYTIHGVSYRAWEPAASVIAAIADFSDISNQLTDPNVEEFSGAISVTLGRLVENNYWLRVMEGVSQFVTGVKTAREWEDMMLTAGKLFLSPVVTTTTGGPAGGRVRELLDPEVKDIRTLTDFYKSKTPGWSKDVPPLLNYSGQPMLIPPAVGGRAMNFFLSQARVKDQHDPVAAFLVKHDLTVNDQWKHFEGLRDPDRPLSRPTGARLRVNLDANESHNWKRLSLTEKDETGRSWVERIAELDQDPGFQALSTFEKQAEITREWASYREFGFDRLKAIDPVVQQRSDRADALTEAIRSGDAGALHREFGVEPDEGQAIPLPQADELEGREPEISGAGESSVGKSLGR